MRSLSSYTAPIWGRILATLIHLIGDFDVAEEATQEAFAAALSQWRNAGVPEHPRAWIIQTARDKAIDRLRQQSRFEGSLEAGVIESLPSEEYESKLDGIPDERLRLICTCCHPALALDAEVALTLRALCGVETDEIARAFMVAPPIMAKRLVRAKRQSATKESSRCTVCSNNFSLTRLCP